MADNVQTRLKNQLLLLHHLDSLGIILHMDAADAFYLAGSIIHCLGKGHVAADGRRIAGFQDENRVAAPMQLMDRPGGNIPAAPGR